MQAYESDVDLLKDTFQGREGYVIEAGSPGTSNHPAFQAMHLEFHTETGCCLRMVLGSKHLAFRSETRYSNLRRNAEVDPAEFVLDTPHDMVYRNRLPASEKAPSPEARPKKNGAPEAAAPNNEGESPSTFAV